MAMNQKERDDFTTVRNDVQWIKANMVTKAEWKPVRAIVFGAVGLILTIFLTSVAGLVFVQVIR